MGLMLTAQPTAPGALSFIASNINDDATVPIGEIDVLRAGDRVEVINHRSGRPGCGSRWDRMRSFACTSPPTP